jgi:murein peptide amidase A
VTTAEETPAGSFDTPSRRRRSIVAAVASAGLVLVLLLVIAAASAVPLVAHGRGFLLRAERLDVRVGLGDFGRGPAAGGWQTIGRSLGGRPIRALTFGNGTRQILYLGGVHGNEWGAGAAGALAGYLAAHPQAVPPDATIHVIECLNPDGRAAKAGPNARGVNLNRNLPTRNWSASPPDRWGAGRRPASEPETRVLMRYLDQYRSAVIVSLHSKGPLIDYDGPGSLAIARRMSRVSGLPEGHMTHTRPMTGSLGIYAPERYGTPVLTVELGRPWLTAAVRDGLLEAAR